MNWNTKRILAGFVILGLSACGGGTKKDSAKSTNDSTINNKNLVEADEGDPSVDDRSNSRSKLPMSYAAMAGTSVGTLLIAWAPTKVEALRKYLMNLDSNEASKINAKLAELVNSKKAYEEITKKLPLQIDDALKGNLSAAETDTIKTRINDLLAKRARIENHIHSVKLQLNAYTVAKEASTNSTVALQVKNQSNSLVDYIDRLTVNNSQGAIDGSNKALVTTLQKDLSWSHTGLAQVDAEIAKVIKANNRVMFVFDNWHKIKIRFANAGKALDVNFHRVFRSLVSKMAQFHTDRIKLSYGDNEPIPRGKINYAKIAYVTAGGFVIVGSGITLWVTLSDAEEEGKNLALNVVRVVDDSEEAPSPEELAELSNIQ